METLICLELLLADCYSVLEEKIRNRTIRKDCQYFRQHAQYHQEELKKIFSFSQKSETTVDTKVSKYLLQFKPLYLPLKGVINLAMHLSAFKMDLYKHLSLMAQEHQDILRNFLQDNTEEMEFLRHEKEFHQIDWLRF